MQIAKLVGITKNSVTSIRNKSYWNYNNLNAKDPVAMGLFTQKDLLSALEKPKEDCLKRKRTRKNQILLIKVEFQIYRQNIIKMLTSRTFWRLLLK